MNRYRMIEQGDTVVAGISGGADSVCLLFLLMEMQRQIPFKIEVVHVNHGIRQDAAQDALFVGKLCKRLGVPFRLVEENVKERARENGTSEEEEGRKVRYQAFEQALGDRKGKVGIAHNSNDRAETMLFHLFRGTGLTGASGIRPVNGKVIRPLLCLQRKEIEAWLWKKGIPFCTDSTNEQDIYTRNRIRHHVLAYAEREVCKGAVANMYRAAEQLFEAEEYISRQTKEALKRCVQVDGEQAVVEIRIPELFKEDEYLRGRVLLESIALAAGRRKDITAAHIKGVEALFRGTGSRELHLPYRLVVYKKYDLGMIKKRDEAGKDKAFLPLRENKVECEVTLPFPSSIYVPGLGRVEFTLHCSKKVESTELFCGNTVFFCEDSQNIPEKTYTKWFDYDKITSAIVFRTRKSGDYFMIHNGMGRKSLQDYFVNEKVPRQDRDKIYLLAEGAHVIWIPGYRISEYYKVHKDTRMVLQVRAVDQEG